MPSAFSVRGATQSPTQAAALQMMGAGGAAPAAQPVPPDQTSGAPSSGENPVAALLAQALDLIIQRQGQEEDLMAVQQFLGFLQQIPSQVLSQAQAGAPPASPSPPLGAGPTPAPLG